MTPIFNRPLNVRVLLGIICWSYLLILGQIFNDPSRAAMSGRGSNGNTWYVGADGWTVFNGTQSGSGTACGNASSTYTGTCVIAVSNSGNDSTCAAQALTVTIANNLASFSPTLPCATPGKAQTLMRVNADDWMVLARGSSWPYGLNWNGGANMNGAWSPNGLSNARPAVIRSYGTGARPLFYTNQQDTSCYSTTGTTRGLYMVILDIECHNDFMDPASANYQGITTVADAYGPTTVSVSAASPAVVTDTVVRPTNDPFDFTSGTLPTGASLNTLYCTTNVSSFTYNFYPATGTTCPGVSSNTVNTSGSTGSGIARTGSQIIQNVGSTTGIGTLASTFTGSISGTTLTFSGGVGLIGVKNGQQLAGSGVSGVFGNILLSACTSSTAGTCTLSSNPGLPAGPQTFTTLSFASGNSWRVWGYGLNGAVIVSFGANTITLASAALFTASAGAIQIEPGWSANAISPAVWNFLYIENVKVSYYGVSIGGVNLIPNNYTTMARNVFLNAYDNNGTGGITFINDTPFWGGQTVIRENLTEHMGWSSVVWGGCGNTFSHDYYLHDNNPGGMTLIRNIVSHASQNGVLLRNGGSIYNSLFVGNPLAISYNSGVTQNNVNVSYNVITDGADVTVAQRFATANATSGTTVSVAGTITGAANNCSFSSGGLAITDIDNPGAIPNGAGIGTVTATSVAITGGSISGGLRGNGVQTGDRIVIFNPGVQGIGANATGGIYIGAGPASGFYGGPTTVSISGPATPAVVSDPDARTQDERFQFVSGSVPTGVSLNTNYCASATGATYSFYPATGSVCPGVSGNLVASTSTGTSGVGRTGTTTFNFPNNLTNSEIILPPWVVVGMNIANSTSQTGFPGNEGISAASTIATIATNRQSLTTTDATTAVMTGSLGAGEGQNVLNMWNTGVPYVSTQVVSPNNVFLNQAGLKAPQFAIGIQPFEQFGNFCCNYFYNWQTAASNNITAFAPTLGNDTVTPQPLNVAGSSSFPTASLEYYDSTLQNNSFTGYISTTYGSGGTGGTLTVLTSVGPANGDTIFGGSTAQYSTVSNCSGSAPTETCLVSISQTVGSSGSPQTFTSGSAAHFLSQAALQDHALGWNAAYTAGAANNFIRNAVGCIATSTPACPPQ
jgi:hypothetical protein